MAFNLVLGFIFFRRAGREERENRRELVSGDFRDPVSLPLS